jgi:hypothetical protein
MPRTNYSFEKRQRDMAKKAKKEEKRKRKLETKAPTASAPGEDTPPTTPE